MDSWFKQRLFIHLDNSVRIIFSHDKLLAKQHSPSRNGDKPSKDWAWLHMWWCNKNNIHRHIPLTLQNAFVKAHLHINHTGWPLQCLAEERCNNILSDALGSELHISNSEQLTLLISSYPAHIQRRRQGRLHQWRPSEQCAAPNCLPWRGPGCDWVCQQQCPVSPPTAVCAERGQAKNYRHNLKKKRSRLESTKGVN